MLLLTSAGFENPETGQVFLQLVGKRTKDIRVMFIRTAAVTDMQLHMADLSKQELVDLGVDAHNIWVSDLGHPVAYEDLNDVDVLYVCGGKTLHLLHQVRSSGFDEVIAQFVSSGRLYVGVSAGSILVGPKVQGERGLALIDCVICPHYTDADKEKVKLLEDTTRHRVVPLSDREALLVCESGTFLLPHHH